MYGIPRVSDGSFLFLQSLINKMENQKSRIGIIFNGSPLYVGDAGSSESEIRKKIIENVCFLTVFRIFFNLSSILAHQTSMSLYSG